MKKFDFVVGNPPFDEETENNGRRKPLYHLFMEGSYKVAKTTLLIHPSRFLFNAGQTPKKWNRKILNDKHLKS
ncbi:Eco57I restriction endonuclease [Peptoniphilus duerdenii ATCC BAA-1640]|uniref:Eco57I restriction endonuclease n=1 Tax=Peptoniphilus duerdenii ATCC BAA-1640 TaxID=862517 RepID=E0NJU0_9FIRM|nr:Eco57I restriction-modification methylase domain-containing protein [Peptoniphilus duerdenii]EFM25885.1 Eco57I restriction endonuclease [Peptoniphilus duerdenii ATCC BAA-1640]